MCIRDRYAKEWLTVDQIGINGWQLIIQLISFIVFIGPLWKFAVGPITSMLDERQDKIRESMEAAERTQAEMKQTLSRNEEILQEARREAQDIVSNGRTTSEQLIAKAREEASAQSDEYLCLLYTSPSPRDGLLYRMPS